MTREPAGGGADFDRFSDEYDEALARGLAVSGEDKLWFARERIAFLAHCLSALGERPDSVLDFGCGTGAGTPYFFDQLGVARVVGVDSSERSLARARAEHGSERARFMPARELVPRGEFALAFCNGVFHHVPPAERDAVVARVRESLRPGGHFALWENNPWNPGARLVMRRISFDRDAVMLSAREVRRLLESGGFEIVRTDHCFVFPHALRGLRWLEPSLRGAPIGAQYQVLARRPRAQGIGTSREMREDASS